jgi:hypothetical protein
MYLSLFMPRPSGKAGTFCIPALVLVFAGLFSGCPTASAADYFVNDSSTNGNVYTTAVGSDLNAGTNAAAPMLTLTNLLATHALGPGDRVFIDTGTYSNYTVTISVSGASGNPIEFIGSTNVTAGGTVFSRNNSNADVFGLLGNHLLFRHLTISNGRSAFAGNLVFPPPSGLILENVTIRNNNIALTRGNWNVSRSLFVDNISVRDPNFSSQSFNHCVFWNNGGESSGNVSAFSISNSVYVGGDIIGSLNGDYNVFWDVRFLNGSRAYLYEWSMPNSFFADPQFVDPGNYNFYPQPNSPLIDFGDPSSLSWTNEPGNNGARINAGLYGGTEEAVETPTNSWLLAITFSDGGTVTGSVHDIRWNYGAIETNDTVSLDYSADAGVNWSNIASGVLVTNRFYSWDVSTINPTSLFWRVVLDSDTNTWSQSGQRFSIGGVRVPYYINDISTSNDYFTIAPGDNLNSGVSPSSPKLTLTDLLDAYKMGKHDVVLVDDGVYSNYTAEINFFGTSTDRFLIEGVSRPYGTIFQRNANAPMFRITANNIELRNMTISDSSSPLGAINADGAGANNFSGLKLDGVVLRDNNTAIHRAGASIENSIFARNSAIISPVKGNYTFHNSVFWSNQNFHAGTSQYRPWSAHNSVFVGGTLNGLPQLTSGDYSLFWNVNLLGFSSLKQLQEDTGQWEHASFGEPLFADPENDNFFPTSPTGRFDPWMDIVVTNDTEYSPLIDFGSPLSTAWTNEPAPNGGRINAGAYGGTAWASKSQTNRWALVLSLNDGGVLNAEFSDLVRWNAGGFSTGDTLRIEISLDAGETWNIAATGISALSGEHAWTNLLYDSSRFARWRIVDESNDQILSQNYTNFTFRNGPYVYYLNNSSTNGNVYTTSPGSDSNTGTSPGSPKATLNNLLSTHPIQPGDIIYVDTGTYNLTANPVIDSLSSGSTSDFVYIIGSTNYSAGGTVWNRQSKSSSAYAFNINSAQYISIEHMTFTNAGVGVRMSSASGSRLEDVRIRNTGSAGIHVLGASSDVLLRHVVSQNSNTNGLWVDHPSASVDVLHSVFWNNNRAGIRVDQGLVSITNSAVSASGATAYAYHAATPSNIVANYNNIHIQSNALAGYITSVGRNLDALSAWVGESGQDRFSLSEDPLFFNPAGGDFHLMTETTNGRYVPGAGFSGTDAATSPLIDAGDIASAFANEPPDNGNRVNIGLYGNTEEASVGLADARLLAAQPSRGGWVKGTGWLHWVSYNMTGDTVSVYWSPDAGENWNLLTNNIAATNELFTWSAGSVSNTPAAVWRVISDTDTNVLAESSGFFALRSQGPLSIYLNDSDTNAAQFTSGPGASTNWVATTERPLDSLADALANYDLEPGDVVYIDTGAYVLSTNAVVARRHGGASNLWVSIVASTNRAAGGSVLDRDSAVSGARALTLQNVQHVAVSNLHVHSAHQGVRLDQSHHIRLVSMLSYSNANHGVYLTGSSNVTFRRVASARNAGLGVRAESQSQGAVEHTILWSNATGALYWNGGSVSVSNSVLHAYGANHYVFDLQGSASLKSDYNNILVEDFARLGLVGSAIYTDLPRWQSAATNDVRSLSHDPLFADAGGLDFHPRSEEGRYDFVAGTFTNDLENSPLIDTGAPNHPFSEEQSPNGSRVNIGLYGNTGLASLSRTNAWLLTVSLNAGGTMRGTNDLHWVAGGSATGDLVTVQFSEDGGLTWTNIQENVPASDGVYEFDSVPFGSTAIAKWRVVSQADTNVLDDTDSTFILNNGPLIYYVNDSSTNGNVYTTQPGNNGNDGVTPETPKASIQDVLQTYSFQQGDRILVDTGEYTLNSEILLNEFIAGNVTNRIVIQGSTNNAAGGTVLNRNGGAIALNFDESSAIEVRNLTIRNATTGIRLSDAQNIVLEWVRVENCADGVDVLNGTSNLDIRHSVLKNNTSSGIANAGTGIRMEQSIVWSNFHGVYNSSGAMSVSNSVIGAFGANRYAYYIQGGSIAANYNNIFLTNGAYAGYQQVNPVPIIYQNVSRWSRDTGRDTMSLSHDPLFADAASGDFYLKSRGGRYLPGVGFTNDTVSSPLIDAGNPLSTFTNETSPNGARLNIGLYGNTEFASRTATNSTLVLVSFNDGGRVEGTTNIYWVAQGNATGHQVRIEFSADSGSNWTEFVTGIPATNQVYAWDTTAHTSTIRGRLRIGSLTEFFVRDTSDRDFAVRNDPLSFYVNDSDTNGLVYTSAEGSVTNNGLTPDKPKASLAQVLQSYDIEPGDTIYVDTGVYNDGATTILDQFSAGSGTNWVTVQGSTNLLDGGTVFDTFGITVQDAIAVRLRDITVQGASTAVRYDTSNNGLVERARAYENAIGFDVANSSAFNIRHAEAVGNTTIGMRAASSSVAARHMVLDSNTVGVTLSSGTLSLRNSVLMVPSPGALGYDWRTGGLDADYNNVRVENGGLAGSKGSGANQKLFRTLSRWARDNNVDRRSLSHDPLFADRAARDFHLQSEAGRWVEGEGWTNDVATSMLIDAGDPASAFDNETDPDGGRVNIGLYGNTDQASRSPSTPRFTAITANDGSRFDGENYLYWATYGDATGDTVRLEYSSDGGQSYSVIVTNVAAADQEYLWDSLPFASSALGVWRVVNESDTNIWDATDNLFALRNTALSFYVNDGSTNDAVYTTASGSSANTGTTPDSPKDRIQDVLSTYEVEPGDTVWIDTGVYTNTTDIVVDEFMAANATNRITFFGSTNTAAGGTLIKRVGGGSTAIFNISDAPGIGLKYLRLEPTTTGIRFRMSGDALVEWVDIRGGARGFDVDNSPSVAMRHSSARGATSGGGLEVRNGSSGTLWQNGVLWSNLYGVNVLGGAVDVSDSVIGAFGSGRYAYRVQTGTLTADYNNLHLTNGAYAGLEPTSPVQTIYQNVSRWFRDFGQDEHSLSHDPLFADAPNGDFRLISQAGRYVPGQGWTNDLVTSPLIDAGNPASDFVLELDPNGQRVNIGQYGGTEQASLTPTNAALFTVSLNDGGRIEGTRDIYWTAQGDATGHTARIDYSYDGGATWTNVATNLMVSAGVYTWDTTLVPSSIRGLWRLVSEDDVSIAATSRVQFAVRNTPLDFYVNDGSVANDVYTFAPGSSTNTGVSADSPRSSVQSILTSYVLEPGDTIYVDTGNYTLTSAITFDQFDQGTVDSRVTVQGSTNLVAGGSVLTRFGGGEAIYINQAQGVALRHLTIRNAGTGVRVFRGNDGLAEWLNVENCATGINIDSSPDYILRNNVICGSSLKGLNVRLTSGTSWESGVMFSNKFGVYLESGNVSVRNTAISAFGSGSFAFGRESGIISSDYNNIHLTNGALTAEILGGSAGGGTNRVVTLSEWIGSTTQDVHTISVDPGFVNPSAGDFHLLSTEGRFLPGTGFVTDGSFSRLIDAGDPASAFDNEEDPNGGRINIGLYGNTEEASMTPTNGWLTVVTLNDGGSSQGSITLRWKAGGAATNHTVRLEFSSDAGASWTNLVTGLNASLGEYEWDSVPYGTSALAKWRVISETDGAVIDEVDNFFALRNGGSLAYYVNNASTNGNVYTSAAGSLTNFGVSPLAPKASVNDVLASYQLFPGDIIYVDTGEYSFGTDYYPAEIVITDLDTGMATNRVIIQGSTNELAGGTVFDRVTGGEETIGIRMELTAGIELRDLTVKNSGTGITISESPDCRLVRVRAQDNEGTGFAVIESSNTSFEQCLAWNNGGAGVSLQNGSLSYVNSIVWGDSTAFSVQVGVARVTNSVVLAGGEGNRVFSMGNAGNVISDYNNLLRTNNAYLASKATPIGGANVYQTLTDWSRLVGQDRHSLSHNPKFADYDNGDFYPLSVEGRWTGTNFVQDAEHSPLIDAGDTNYPFALEQDPNGDRINIGMFGNNAKASLSRTNKWLLAVTFNDGGVVNGTNDLYWIAGNFETNDRVRVEYSINNGVEWVELATNLPVYTSKVEWDASTLPVTLQGRWRVQYENDSLIGDENDNAFTIRNDAQTYYVNDSSTNGAVFTTAVGNPTNTGRSASSPLDSLARVMEIYPILAGDVIYIDTGVYNHTNDVVFNDLNRGIEGQPVRIIGSTNYLAGGTVIDRGSTNATDTVLRFVNMHHASVEHITVRNGGTGVSMVNSIFLSMTNVWSHGHVGDGFAVNTVSPVRMTRCASWDNGGYGLTFSGSQSSGLWENGVLWSNASGAVDAASGSLTINNSFLHAFGDDTVFVYKRGQTTGYNGDYNFLWLDGDARVGFNEFSSVEYATLRAWSVAQNMDRHSLIENPLFADANAGNFHLQSSAGRFVPEENDFTNDVTTSWAIDAANPTNAFDLELSPNGNRMNIGLFGNTPYASKTETNRALKAVTLNDGGTASGLINLYWLTRGLTTNDTVTLQYSSDGVAWTNIASGLPATQTEYAWASTNFLSSPFASWRVVYDGDTNILSETDNTFFMRNGAFIFYVNDDQTNGNIYTTEPGDSSNLGLSPSTPMRNLQEVLDTYELEEGDTVLVDAGYYVLTNHVEISGKHQSSALNPITIVGSTNFAGTVFDRADTNLTDTVGILFQNANNFRLSDITIQNADVGIQITQSAGNSISNMVVRDGGVHGLNIGGNLSSNNKFNRVIVTRFNGTGLAVVGAVGGTSFSQGIIWSNSTHAISVAQNASVSVSNSILSAFGKDNLIYSLATNATVRSDYNNLVVDDEAQYGMDFTPVPVRGLPQWSAVRTQDVHSISMDPLFADPANDDFHPQSIQGRFVDGFGWTNDLVHSPLIDTANPLQSSDNEPVPNGSRLNLGYYGNSPQASLSRTNAWLLAVTASPGGLIAGTFPLVWAWGGVASNETVQLDYSFDDGVTWTNIVDGVEVSEGEYIWNSAEEVSGNEKFPSSPIARWRIVLESDTNVYSTNKNFFALRNRAFSYYINNSSTNGNVYSTAPGSDTNLGFFASSPKATLSGLFADLRLDIRGEDSVLVDTGIYPVSSNAFFELTQVNSGLPDERVRIRGSTNFAAGGTVFDRQSEGGPATIFTISGDYVEVEDLVFWGGHLAASGQDIKLRNITFTNGNLTLSGQDQFAQDIRLKDGSISISGADIVQLHRVKVEGAGINVANSDTVAISNTLVFGGSGTALTANNANNLTVRNSTLASDGNQFNQFGSGNSILRNNIIVADGLDTFALIWDGGALDSDYNNLIARNGAWIGRRNGQWEKLIYWQENADRDLHSISMEPDFVDPGSGNYYLRSMEGRWNGTNFVTDLTHSPSIDTGSPSSPVGEEPAPNGGRVNMGAFANTDEASMSRTNAWLLALSLNDGGLIQETETIRWIGGNLSGSISLQYSPDNGLSWSNIQTGIAVTGAPTESDSYAWDTTLFPDALFGLWRVVWDADTNVYDVVDNSFTVRNNPTVFYVNNHETNDNVYTTEPGDNANDGLTTSTPKASLRNLLETYETDAGDIIYVDTGEYVLTNDARVIWSRGGHEDLGRLTIQGSTNYDAGGTVFIRGNKSSGRGIDLKAEHVNVFDINVRDAHQGVFLDNNSHVSLTGMLIYSNSVGVLASNAHTVVLRNMRFWNNNQGGFDTVNARTTTVENITFVGNTPFNIRQTGTLRNNILQNNIHVLTVTNSSALAGSAFNTFIDYNVYDLTATNAQIFSGYTTLLPWQLDFAHDYRSAITNPVLADATAGNFHPMSEFGRYVSEGVWTNDGVTSWGIDRGNPDMAFDEEPGPSGNRINIGAFGGTKFASLGTTNEVIDIRQLNEPTLITTTNSIWPLIWSVINVPTNLLVDVQYSGDGGTTWTNLQANAPVYNEVYVWLSSPTFNSYKGLWRINGQDGPDTYAATNSAPIRVLWGTFEIDQHAVESNLQRIRWSGSSWDEFYQVQYTEDGHTWTNAVSGTNVNQEAYFLAPRGGSFFFQDIESTNRFRSYRVLEIRND